MFENIRLKDLKGLRQCELLSLGKMNVLCGKNNSGKSTILEAIRFSGTRASGKSFGEKDIDTLCDRGSLAVYWGHGVQSSSINYCRQLVSRTASSRNVWYSDEVNGFIATIKGEFDTHSGLRGHQFPMRILGDGYRSFMPENQRIDLLPPKRRLDLQKSVTSSEAADAEGGGILNQLFLAANQPLDTDKRKFYDTLSEAFNDISAGYEFAVHLEENNQLHLRFAFESGPWIDAVNSGLGLQDLLIILYFAVTPSNEVVLIEEPECHMHPEMQRRLLYFLRKKTSKQFFFSTHSNVFLSDSLVDRVFYVLFDNQVRIEDATSKATVLAQLGYSIADNLVSDVTILTEGPSDIAILEEFLTKMDLFKNYTIKCWPLGGDIMDQVDLTVIKQNTKVIALVDKDPASSSIRNRFIKNCKDLNIPVTRLKRYSIENYFTVPTLQSVFGAQIPTTVTIIDPNKKLEDQIGLNPKKNSRKIAQAMTLDDIKGTDLLEFLKAVERKCKE